MKETHGWWWPDHERHMPAWMDSPKNRHKLNGRWTYQGRKQTAVLERCPPTGIAIDVGAHVGLWAFNLAHHFEHVHAFEPVADHRACFLKNMAVIPNYTLHDCALGAEHGSVSMWTEDGSSGNTQVRGDGDIPLKMLDDFDLRDVRCLKLDCEGYEQNVIRGGIETIKREKPVIIVEQKREMAARFHLPLRGAVTELQGMGYKVAEEISGDFVMVHA